MRPLAIAAVVVLGLWGSACGAISRGGKLSHRGAVDGSVYLSTGGSPRAFRTVGFVQVRGYGVEVAGLVEVGDAALDHTVRGVLAEEARKMGGQAVIHIDFLDENPSTDFERVAAAASSVSSVSGRGGGGVEQKSRYVTATGEVIQFLE